MIFLSIPVTERPEATIIRRWPAG